MSTGTKMAAIGRLLSPDSIALVGATENSFWSFSIIENLRTLGYQGAIHMVHPTKATQFGAQCYPSVRDIPGPVDHAWVMTATGVAMSVLADCAAKGIRSVTMLTAGFKEVGPEGARLEQEVIQFCREHGITLLGPNCLGFLNGRRQVPAYALLLGEAPIPGHIGVVLQSGALLLHFHRLAVNRGIGLSYLVSSGNEGMLDACDFLRFLVEDPETKVVAALLEGIRDPKAFKAIADRAMALGKPIVVLKTGRSQAASRSATAHTGALTGVDAVVDAYLRQLGVIRVDSVEEMVETAGLLQARGWPEAGCRAGVVTPSGGACGIFADICHNKAIELPDFSAATKERLKAILPEFGTPQNPLDTTGYVVIDGTLIPRTLEVIAQAPECDIAVVVTDPPAEPGLNPQRTKDRLERLAGAVSGSAKYVCLVSTVAGELTRFGRSAAAEHGLHYANGLTLGAAALDRAIRYGEARKRYLARQASASASLEQTDRSDLPEALNGPSDALSEAESKRLIASFGIQTPRELIALDPEAAVAAAAEIGGTVVLKVLSADVPHKTEAGGVALDLRTPEEVRSAYGRVIASVHDYKPDARVEGVLVAEQVTGAVEMIAGVTVDPLFGPVVVAGLGGVLVEVIRDVAMRLPPFDKAEALSMLGELRGRSVLDGVRGRPAADVAALADTLVRLGDMAVAMQDRLAEVDLNPLFVLPAGQGVRAADALVVLKAQGGH